MHKGTGGGGLQHRMSILRNGNAACLCRLFSSMSHDESKKRLCPMSIHFYPSCRMSLSSMSQLMSTYGLESLLKRRERHHLSLMYRLKDDKDLLEQYRANIKLRITVK